MANSDTQGLAKQRRIIADNQHDGRGSNANTIKMGTRGTGKDGNGTSGGGINRSTKPTPQH